MFWWGNRNQYLFSIVHEENEVVTGQMKCLHNDWITQLELGHCDTWSTPNQKKFNFDILRNIEETYNFLGQSRVGYYQTWWKCVHSMTLSFILTYNFDKFLIK